MPSARMEAHRGHPHRHPQLHPNTHTWDTCLHEEVIHYALQLCAPAHCTSQEPLILHVRRPRVHMVCMIEQDAHSVHSTQWESSGDSRKRELTYACAYGLRMHLLCTPAHNPPHSCSPRRLAPQCAHYTYDTQTNATTGGMS